jgi:monoterpene epsilon-lactone hydrolase
MNQPKPVTPRTGAYATVHARVVHGRKMKPSRPHQNELNAMLIRSPNNQMKKIASLGEMNAANATMHPHMERETTGNDTVRAPERAPGEESISMTTSPEALALWQAFSQGPKQAELPLAARREAGEQAETPTSEPAGIIASAAPEVDGIWARPEAPREGAAVLYLYGGGYVLGSPASRRKTAGHVANACAAEVLVPKYRLAPEHPFPAAVDDAVAAYRFLLGQGARPAQTVIMGDSAGGGLAFACALALRDAGDPMPAGVVGLSPWGDLACRGGTMDTCAGVDIMCTKDALLDMAGMYLAGRDALEPLASPVYADLAGLPPALILVGGDEVLLDDAVRLTRGIGEGGADATLFVGAGMQHVWPTWAGAIPEADAAITLIGDWVRRR